MRVACWTPKAKNTHLEYVILIAFPLQQWLHERASMLRYAYITCLMSENVSVYETNMLVLEIKLNLVPVGPF